MQPIWVSRLLYLANKFDFKIKWVNYHWLIKIIESIEPCLTFLFQSAIV